MLIKDILDIIESNKDIRYVSFDIFDTLLLRTVSIPTDVFKYMYYKNPELFPDYSNDEDFVCARTNAEKNARKKQIERFGNHEVKIEEIYEELPYVYKDKALLIEKELEAELDNTFCNEDIYETIQQLKELNIDIFLISDMYLGEKNIKKLLENANIDISLFRKIYVSCEYSANKYDGELYDIFLAENGIPANKLLHVGDNYRADVGVPLHKGIKSCHYNVISNARYHYPYLSMETMLYRDKLADELLAIRLVAASHCNETIEEKFWFDLGAMVFGPFLSYATEWILDQADEKHISVIRPLMREGKFITTLLNNAMEARNLKLDIEPVYVSRLSAISSEFGNISRDVIENLTGTCNMKLVDVFKVLNISDMDNPFGEYQDEYMNDLAGTVLDEDYVRNRVIDFLCSDEVVGYINKKNENNVGNLIKYLDKMKMKSKPAITVDFGWRANIQNSIDNILGSSEVGKSPLIHLLFFSNFNALKNVKKGSDIRGYIGNWGKNGYELKATFPRILELAFYCSEGTTIGYKEKNGEIIPITQLIEYPEWQKKAMLDLQKGVLEFQRLFLAYKRELPRLQEWDRNRIGVCNILLRLCSYPTYMEASYLGKLEYDQNFGSNILTRIISEEELAKLSKNDFCEYYSKFQNSGAKWNSGLNVIKDPTIYLKNIYLLNRKYIFLSFVYMCEKIIAMSGNKPFVIVGGGGNSKIIIETLRFMNAKMPVSILDNNPYLWGANVGGILITPITRDTLSSKYCYLFSITGREMYNSLRSQISEILRCEYTFVSYYEENNVE